MAYQPIQMPAPEASGLGSGIGEMLLRARQLEQQRDAQRAEMLLRRDALSQEKSQQEAIRAEQKRRLDMEEGAAKEKSAERQLEFRKAITQAIDQGNIDLARQIARTAGFTDFGSQSITGPEGQVTRPNPGFVPGLEGPQISPEDARRAAFIRSGGRTPTELEPTVGPQDMTAPGNIDLMNRPSVRNEDGSVSTVRSMGINVDGKETLVPTVGDEGKVLSDEDAIERYQETGKHLGQFGSIGASNDFAQRLHEQQERFGPLAEQEEAERQRFASAQTPTVQETVPGKSRDVYAFGGETYDPQKRLEGEAAARQRAVGITKQAFGGTGPEYADLAATLSAAGLGPDKVATVVAAQMEKDEGRKARAFEGEAQRKQSDINNQRMAAAIAAGRGEGVRLKEEAGDRQEETGLDAVTKNVFGNFGFKESKRVGGKYTRLASLLSKPNAATDAVVAGSFVKEAQGGTGVISDADMEAFWNRIGGVTERTAQWVQNVINGKIAPEKRAIVLQAVQELAGQELQKQGEIKDALRERITNSTYANRVDDVMATYFPEERARVEDNRAIMRAREAEKAKDKTRSNKLKGGGKDALDRDLDGL